jgi:hypothetical protein
MQFAGRGPSIACAYVRYLKLLARASAYQSPLPMWLLAISGSDSIDDCPPN